MDTKVLNIDENDIKIEDIEECAKIIRDGGTVAFPTETVYGLGANALNSEAIFKIYEAKGRPSDNPLIVHVAKIEDVNQLVKHVPEKARRLMEIFWPGPLTIILEKSDIIPLQVSGGLNTVAIRMPDHKIALSLIEASGLPIAAPSANISGRPSPTMGEHVVEDLFGRVDAIIIGEDCVVGLESTVLDMSENVATILRPGGVTRERLLEVLDEVIIDPAIEKGMDNVLIPKAPGMKYVHYAPRAEVVLVKGDVDATVKKITELIKENIALGKNVGVLCFNDTCQQYKEVMVKSLGDRQNLEQVASNIFRQLREFDKTNVQIIIAEAVVEQNMGQAIMNRLIKAAGYQVINA